jgi:hypothetical protein
MSCCGKKRDAMRRPIPSVTAPPASSAREGAEVLLHYKGGSSILVRGARSSKTYFFASDKPEQKVSAGDVDGLLRTGLFLLME